MLAVIWRPLVVLVGALALAACGGSHSSSTSSTVSGHASGATTSSGPEGTYQTQVNAICAGFNKQMEAINLPNQPTMAKLAVLQRQAVAQIRRVKPPSSIAAPVASWLRSAERAVIANAEMAKTLKKDPNLSVQNSQAATAYGNNAHAAFAKAKALGLDSCAVVGAV